MSEPRRIGEIMLDMAINPTEETGRLLNHAFGMVTLDKQTPAKPKKPTLPKTISIKDVIGKGGLAV